jgi:hypothetical protein
MGPETDFEADDQDRAEVLDETNLTEDGAELANFDDIDDVYDVTTAEGDNDDDDDEFDEDEPVDDNDLESERDDEGLDIEREPLAASARTADSHQEDDVNDIPTSDQTKRFEADHLSDEEIKALGYGEDASAEADADVEHDPHVDHQLDKGLKETFPASDPVSINPGAD